MVPAAADAIDDREFDRDFLGQSQWGFMSVSCTLNTAPHQQNFTFCMKPLGERRKEFHHGETFGHSFTCVGNRVKPH
jgi:hypothetical protein